MKESTYKKHCQVIDEWFTNGRNGTQAYKSIYPNVSENVAAVKFAELVRNGKIEEYIATKENKVSTQHEITLESIIDELNEAQALAKKTTNPQAMIAAIKEKAKLVGLYEKHNEQKRDLQPQQYQTLLDQLLSNVDI